MKVKDVSILNKEARVYILVEVEKDSILKIVNKIEHIIEVIAYLLVEADLADYTVMVKVVFLSNKVIDYLSYLIEHNVYNIATVEEVFLIVTVQAVNIIVKEKVVLIIVEENPARIDTIKDVIEVWLNPRVVVHFLVVVMKVYKIAEVVVVYFINYSIVKVVEIIGIKIKDDNHTVMGTVVNRIAIVKVDNSIVEITKVIDAATVVDFPSTTATDPLYSPPIIILKVYLVIENQGVTDKKIDVKISILIFILIFIFYILVVIFISFLNIVVFN